MYNWQIETTLINAPDLEQTYSECSECKHNYENAVIHPTLEDRKAVSIKNKLCKYVRNNKTTVQHVHDLKQTHTKCSKVKN